MGYTSNSGCSVRASGAPCSDSAPEGAKNDGHSSHSTLRGGSLPDREGSSPRNSGNRTELPEPDVRVRRPSSPCDRSPPVEQVLGRSPLQDGGRFLLRDLIQKGDFFWKVDLKDVYLTVLMSSASQTLLGFQWDGRRFQFRALPFGLSSAPWIFTKILHPVIAVLRQWGYRLVVYLDDILAIGRSAGEAIPATAALIQCIQKIFSQTLFDFKKSISGPIELKFSGKTLYAIL